MALTIWSTNRTTPMCPTRAFKGDEGELRSGARGGFYVRRGRQISGVAPSRPRSYICGAVAGQKDRKLPLIRVDSNSGIDLE
jgi:hypothetical protein